ncbi:hypothetical protein ES703_115645 [subsurface metagenome]
MSKMPLGMRAPSFWNFSLDLRKSTTSVSSCLASSTPATSSKVTVGVLPCRRRARLRPKLIAWLLAPRAERNKKKMRAPKRMRGIKPMSRLLQSKPEGLTL